MSAIAIETPASSGGPSDEREPVTGSAVPIFSVSSPPAAPPSPVAAQPERTNAAAARVATAVAVFLLRRENENELIFLLYIMGFEPPPKNMVQVPKYRLGKFRKP
jgi:hypothetical protein